MYIGSLHNTQYCVQNTSDWRGLGDGHPSVKFHRSLQKDNVKIFVLNKQSFNRILITLKHQKNVAMPAKA